MIKRRKQDNNDEKFTEEALEAFASGADAKIKSDLTLNPNAKRNYKAISLSLNKYEYFILDNIAKKTGRSKLNLIRWAILKIAEEV